MVAAGGRRDDATDGGIGLSLRVRLGLGGIGLALPAVAAASALAAAAWTGIAAAPPVRPAGAAVCGSAADDVPLLWTI